MSKRCIHCGAELHMQAVFCHSCAQSQIKKAKPGIPAAWRRKAVFGALIGAAVIALLLTAFFWRNDGGFGFDPGESVSPEPSESVSLEPSESVSPEPSESVSPEPSESVSPEPSESVSPEPSESVSPEPSESVPDPAVSEEPRPSEEIPVEAGHYFACYSGTEDYVRRKLSNEQLRQLRDADIYVLQERISTVADAVAYLDQFPHEPDRIYDAIDSDFIMDIAFMLNLHRTEATAPDVYTCFTGWCLADDYPAARYLVSTGTCPGFTWIYHSLLLPDEAGFRVITPAGHSKQWSCVFGFEEVSVSTLEGLEEHLMLIHAGMADDSEMFLYHLFSAEVGTNKLKFWKDDNYLVTIADAEELYRRPENVDP